MSLYKTYDLESRTRSILLISAVMLRNLSEAKQNNAFNIKITIYIIKCIIYIYIYITVMLVYTVYLLIQQNCDPHKSRPEPHGLQRLGRNAVAGSTKLKFAGSLY